jgi:hypothetical protein
MSVLLLAEHDTADHAPPTGTTGDESPTKSDTGAPAAVDKVEVTLGAYGGPIRDHRRRSIRRQVQSTKQGIDSRNGTASTEQSTTCAAAASIQEVHLTHLVGAETPGRCRGTGSCARRAGPPRPAAEAGRRFCLRRRGLIKQSSTPRKAARRALHAGAGSRVPGRGQRTLLKLCGKSTNSKTFPVACSK